VTPWPQDDDPLDVMVRQFRERGKPSLDWVVRWSRYAEPVQAAWDRCFAPEAMFWVLQRAPHPLYRALVALDASLDEAWRLIPIVPLSLLWAADWDVYDSLSNVFYMRRSRSVEFANAFRRAVPVSPRLSELMRGAP
jgi:hypothetical protein